MTKQKSKSRKIPLYDLKISVAARREVADSLASGWLSSGPKTSAFEKAIADLLHTRHAAAVNSCTVGLQILLGAIGAGRGKQVITTPFTFAATVEAIMATGATPVFADIDPRTLNIDAEEVARKVTSKTVAIVPVDIGGYPANYAKMKRVAKQCSVSLIADAAHSIGTTYKGKTISQLVDAAVYSFHATKNLTCGEGGMVVSRHKDLIAAVKLISSHGMTSGAYQRKKSEPGIMISFNRVSKQTCQRSTPLSGLAKRLFLDKNSLSAQSVLNVILEILRRLQNKSRFPNQLVGTGMAGICSFSSYICQR